jgi:hypothetical protein
MLLKIREVAFIDVDRILLACVRRWKESKMFVQNYLRRRRRLRQAVILTIQRRWTSAIGKVTLLNSLKIDKSR